MAGIIGKKIGMTSVFSVEGKNIPCTVIEAGPCVVTQVKTEETDGYEALQLAYGEKKEKKATKAEFGHFKKAGVTPKRKVVEFKNTYQETFELGQEIDVNVFHENDYVDVVGVSKGKAVIRGPKNENTIGSTVAKTAIPAKKKSVDCKSLTPKLFFFITFSLLTFH